MKFEKFINEAMASDPYTDFLKSKGFKFDTSQVGPAGSIDRSGRRVYVNGKYTVIITRDSSGRSRWTYKIGPSVAKSGYMISGLKDYFKEIGK